jgi:3-hydroxymyristoyl/3-hydroxydecanoyl-(acyl carrier protein) dehydratase
MRSQSTALSVREAVGGDALPVSDHFAAFSFVYRIHALEPGVRAQGSFAIPADLAAFPSCLLAEAVGQLAAWVAMARIDFRGRPVAALANETRFHAPAGPGQALALAVEIEHCDDEAVAYRGTADVDGVRAIELVDCLGPMLPVAEFDDPGAMAAWFALLCGEGAPAERFHGVAPAKVDRDGGVVGESASARLLVPASAPYFNDHFPRRPVFPATLMLDAQIELALAVARESDRFARGAALEPLRMTRVKVRSFTPPGQQLTITAALQPASGAAADFHLAAAAEGKTVATARVEIGERGTA